jgi:hypothetical protein
MKHNNPFKMKGPWIGAVAYICLVVLSAVLMWNTDSFFLVNITEFPGKQIISSFNLFNTPGCGMECYSDAIDQLGVTWIFGLITWFLAGWGIQVLTKKVRK